ncbi:MAG: hypothetical protein V4794_03785 [Pseudomonadota bacterium]
MSAMHAGVLREHAALTRHLGTLQDRVSRLLREKETEVQALSREIVRLRAQLLLSRTSKLWRMN